MVMGRRVFLLKSWTHDFGYPQKDMTFGHYTRWGRLIVSKWTYGALKKTAFQRNGFSWGCFTLLFGAPFHSIYYCTGFWGAHLVRL